jgi:hypothetical protein
LATVGLSISKEQSASVSLTPEVAELSVDQKTKINSSVGSELDKKLGRDLALSFGAHIDAAQLAALTGSLKLAIRGKLSVLLGLSGDVGGGGGVVAGGSAGAGATAGVSAGATAGASASATGGASAGVALGGAGGVQGGSTLGFSVGLRPGSVPGAGGGGEALAGVTIGGGLQADAVAGLTAGLTTLADARATAGMKLKAAASVKVSLGAIMEAALTGAGLSVEKRAALKAEIGPAVDEAFDTSLRSTFGPIPGFPHAAGTLVLNSEVRMPLVGAWHANVEIDPDDPVAPPPTGPFWFEVEGVEFRGSVVPGRSGAVGGGGRTGVHIVGGAGGLSQILKPRNYAGGVTRVRAIVDDILRDCGETLSEETDKTLLDKQINGWQRAAQPANQCLVLVLDQIGATWRVLRDGTIWIGVEMWPEVEPDGTVLDEDWSDGMILVAPDRPNMVPGVVVRGQRIEQVVHRNERGGLRTELHAQSVSGHMRRILQSVRSETDFAKKWPCRVVQQNSDGTVQVLTDDEKMRGRGTDKVRIRVGIPGTRITVSSGARGHLAFDGADPSLPYIDGWESATDEDKTVITYPGGTRPAAGLGSMVRVILPYIPLPAPGPPAPFPVFGFIETGNDQNIT